MTFFIRMICACLVLGATPAMAQWDVTVQGLGLTVPGTTGRVSCPAGGPLVSTVYGTQIYTHDSSVCAAAVHMGWINVGAGGVVTFEVLPGMAAYESSSRNGITSSSWGTWGTSFRIYTALPGQPSGGSAFTTIDWGASPLSLGLDLATSGRYYLSCPSGGSPSSIWGTTVYTTDSSICTAAAHTGRISFAAGGQVAIDMVGPRSEYTSHSANGITSGAWGSYPTSFTFAPLP